MTRQRHATSFCLGALIIGSGVSLDPVAPGQATASDEVRPFKIRVDRTS